MPNNKTLEEMKTNITREVMEACKDTLENDYGLDMEKITPFDVQKLVMCKLEETEHDKLFFLAGYLSAIEELK